MPLTAKVRRHRTVKLEEYALQSTGIRFLGLLRDQVQVSGKGLLLGVRELDPGDRDRIAGF